jgi:outer membrane biosynthesis protein TonB
LAWAFVISLILHLLTYKTYEVAKKYGWWQKVHLPTWLQSPRMLTEILKKQEAAKPPPPTEVPLVFVDVSQAQATAEPPKKTEFYSDKNSQAANPDPKEETEKPKIDGKQTETVKTEDVPKAETFPLRPTVKPAEQAKEPQEEAEPKPAYTPGDLAMAKPEPIPRKTAGEAPRQRPRTIEEALARLPNSQLVGQKMKQDGGVKRGAIIPSLDAEATAFGAYDAALIAAVQNRWYHYLDSRNYASDERGKVTVKFRLHSSGSISEITLVDHTVDLALSLICQSAIQDSAPYAKWPSDMRKLIQAEYREITFTFIYY